MIPTLDGLPRFESGDGIARITLARASQRNRLQNEDLIELAKLFRRIDADRSIRVVVVGADVLPQRPVFSAGYNLGDLHSGSAPDDFEELVQQLEQLRPVTICMLNGSVYGGATDLVLACDLALAAEGVELRMVAAALGLHFYPSGLMRYVSRLGVTAAKRALLTAQALDAATLLKMGCVQELVPSQDLPWRVNQLASEIAALAPLALESLKQTLNELARGDVDLARIRSRQQRTMDSQDFREGRLAMQERRRPVWKGC